MKRHTFHMPFHLEDVDTTVLAVMSKLEAFGQADVIPKVQMCLSEALYNLVQHSKGSDVSKPVEITLCVKGKEVELEIFDPEGAQPFDPRDHAPEISEVNLMAESGRGLALIMHYADGVDYDVADNRNRLRLNFGEAQ